MSAMHPRPTWLPSMTNTRGPGGSLCTRAWA